MTQHIRYQFKCKDCENIFIEEYKSRQEFSECVVHPCPNCGNTNTYQLYENTPIIFNGSGFTVPSRVG